ncbi:MAG: adenine-specific methyltransferase EcoRI family protein [Bacteroidales bacterium]|nr:adenine-specific methyltransferase EcoRI family protein [Bacteroidales bacterium]
MAGNINLHAANKAKKDEFYTQLVDIENELRHYKEHFKGKTVLCNCDDPRVSNFFHYFSYNFEQLGLKKLITTCYKNQNRDLFSQNDAEQAIWLEYFGDRNGNRVPDPEEIGIHYFKGDGDFRSQECIDLLKEADIVVTNPPFSLFREYVAQLIKYEKKFVIIGNQNAITNKDFFPLIRDNKLWLGYGFKGGAGHFYSKYEDVATAGDHRKGMIRVSGVNWFTNLEIQKRHEDIILFKTYNPEEYPKYENFDAIDVEKVSEIPCDYYGIMGVPDTLLDQYNPEQFEILGADGIPQSAIELGIGRIGEEWMQKYRANGGTGHYTANMKSIVLVRNDMAKKPYSRIFIRRKQKPIDYASIEQTVSMAAEGTE